MPKVISIILLCIGFIRHTRCQSAYYPYAAPYLASANAGGSFVNALNAAFNPSLIPFIEPFEGACHAEKKYVTDLNIILLTGCATFNDNGISIIFQRYGNKEFNENTFGISYGKKIGIINAGITCQNIRVKVQGGESISLIKTGIASSINVAENVFVSCRISNPNMFAKVSQTKLQVASSYSLSLGLETSPVVYAAIESLKEEGRPLSLIFSLQYRLTEKLSCALNWNTYSSQPYAAISWRQKMFTIESGCSYHSVLGASPTVSVFYKKIREK